MYFVPDLFMYVSFLLYRSYVQRHCIREVFPDRVILCFVSLLLYHNQVTVYLFIGLFAFPFMVFKLSEMTLFTHLFFLLLVVYTCILHLRHVTVWILLIY